MSRIDVSEVAPPLGEILSQATEELAVRLPKSLRVKRLAKKVASLDVLERQVIRDAWIAGMRGANDTVSRSWKRVVRALDAANGQAKDAALSAASERLYVRSPSQAALMFGAFAPRVTTKDVRCASQLLIEQYASSPDVQLAGLWEHVVNAPVDLGAPPWQDAMRRAEEFRESIGLEDDVIDIDAVYALMGVEQKCVRLDDQNIRAIAIVSPNHRPTVALNESSPWSDSAAAARFTLAHELCHLLFDQQEGNRLAVASGPWAAYEVEQRANAFAAYLLLPPGEVRRYAASMGVAPASEEGVRSIAEHFGVSYGAAIEHLPNIGVINETDRDKLRPDYS